MKTISTPPPKNILSICVAVFYVLLLGQPTSLLAQSGQKWATGGNTISNGDYLGTNNAQKLAFKVNAVLQLTIKTNGLVLIEDRLKVKNKITTDTLKVNNKLKAGYLSGNGTVLLQATNNGVIKSFLFPGNSQQVLFGNGTWGNLPPDNGWKVNGNDMFAIPTGNIGIGTETPQKKLDVNGTGVFRDSLGIGVLNPQAPLDVQGNVIVRGWIYAQNGVVVGKRFEGQKVQTDTINTQKSMSIVAKSDTSISKISTTDTLTSQKINTKKIKVEGLIINGNTNKIYSTAGNISFNNTNFDNVGTLNANTVHADNLNVSYTDFDSLHVTEKIKIGLSSLYLSSHTDLNGTENSIYTENGDLLIQSNSGNTNNTIINQGDEGFVGIGTNDPKKKLHVRSFIDLSINPAPVTGLGSVRIEDEYYDGSISKTSTWDIEPMVQLDPLQAATILPSAPVKLNIGTPNAPVLTLLAGGRVGIGTQNPDEMLQVEGQYAKARIGFGENYLKVGYNSTHAIIESHGTNTEHGKLLINWYSGNDVVVGGGDNSNECTPTGNFSARHSAFLATIDGNVGIGTDNPQAKLDVNGRINIGGSDLVLGTNDNRYQGSNTGQRALVHSEGSNQNEDFLVINYAGDFDNGVIIQGQKTVLSNDLYVNGTIHSNNFEVELASWPDRVFDNHYALMPLSKLEQYITTYKHLPDIPSETEVLNNGVDLIDINTKLLQKVEELTLYIIEQDKRIKKLEDQANPTNN